MQQRDEVARTFAERRDADGRPRDAEVEVLAERALVHQPAKVSLRRHDDAEDLRIERWRQLALDGERQLCRRVEDERAALGVAERLLERVGDLRLAREPGALDDDERAAGACGRIVDRPRERLLPSPGLAREDDRALRLREVRERREDLSHRRRRALEPAERERLAERRLRDGLRIAVGDGHVGRADADHRTRRDPCLGDLHAVDVRAVAAAEIAHPQTIRLRIELEVQARHGLVGDDELAVDRRPRRAGLAQLERMAPRSVRPRQLRTGAPRHRLDLADVRRRQITRSIPAFRA